MRFYRPGFGKSSFLALTAFVVAGAGLRGLAEDRTPVESSYCEFAPASDLEEKDPDSYTLEHTVGSGDGELYKKTIAPLSPGLRSIAAKDDRDRSNCRIDPLTGVTSQSGCQPLCGLKRAGQTGDFFDCVNMAWIQQMAAAGSAFEQFARTGKKLKLRVVPDNWLALKKLLQTSGTAPRKIEIVVGGQTFGIDLTGATWVADWKKVIEAACPDGVRECAPMNRFVSKYLLLEKAAKLRGEALATAGDLKDQFQNIHICPDVRKKLMSGAGHTAGPSGRAQDQGQASQSGGSPQGDTSMLSPTPMGDGDDSSVVDSIAACVAESGENLNSAGIAACPTPDSADMGTGLNQIAQVGGKFTGAEAPPCSPASLALARHQISSFFNESRLAVVQDLVKAHGELVGNYDFELRSGSRCLRPPFSQAIAHAKLTQASPLKLSDDEIKTIVENARKAQKNLALICGAGLCFDPVSKVMMVPIHLVDGLLGMTSQAGAYFQEYLKNELGVSPDKVSSFNALAARSGAGPNHEVYQKFKDWVSEYQNQLLAKLYGNLSSPYLSSGYDTGFASSNNYAGLHAAGPFVEGSFPVVDALVKKFPDGKPIDTKAARAALESLGRAQARKGIGRALDTACEGEKEVPWNELVGTDQIMLQVASNPAQPSYPKIYECAQAELYKRQRAQFFGGLPLAATCLGGGFVPVVGQVVGNTCLGTFFTMSAFGYAVARKNAEFAAGCVSATGAAGAPCTPAVALSKFEAAKGASDNMIMTAAFVALEAVKIGKGYSARVNDPGALSTSQRGVVEMLNKLKSGTTSQATPYELKASQLDELIASSGKYDTPQALLDAMAEKQGENLSARLPLGKAEAVKLIQEMQAQSLAGGVLDAEAGEEISREDDATARQKLIRDQKIRSLARQMRQRQQLAFKTKKLIDAHLTEVADRYGLSADDEAELAQAMAWQPKNLAQLEEAAVALWLRKIGPEGSPLRLRLTRVAAGQEADSGGVKPLKGFGNWDVEVVEALSRLSPDARAALTKLSDHSRIREFEIMNLKLAELKSELGVDSGNPNGPSEFRRLLENSNQGPEGAKQLQQALDGKFVVASVDSRGLAARPVDGVFKPIMDSARAAALAALLRVWMVKEPSVFRPVAEDLRKIAPTDTDFSDEATRLKATEAMRKDLERLADKGKLSREQLSVSDELGRNRIEAIVDAKSAGEIESAYSQPGELTDAGAIADALAEDTPFDKDAAAKKTTACLTGLAAAAKKGNCTPPPKGCF